MHILKRRNWTILIISLALIACGFIFMKLESAEYGFGSLALIVAPILVIGGFLLGVVSIFFGTVSNVQIKRQLPFLIAGLTTFIISLIVYIITLEETASLWDCAEFIACAYKLQVPHAPGAPLFLMIGRLFSLFAFGDTLMVAYWVNMVSAISSALAVMFTFWTVVMLGRRLSPKNTNFPLILAGLVGSFSIAFADSFWFSAAEAETYAMATLFLIVSFWSILKWEQSKNEKVSNNWLVFIMYLLGLSIGVHPMSLLIIPAISIIISFKSRAFSWKSLLLAICAGSLMVLFLNHIVLFGLPEGMKFFDIFFVNTLGLPFYSGAIVFLVLIVLVGYLSYQWSVKKHYKFMSVLIIGLMYFLIGYSSYFMIIIRSQANPSIDEHNPENLVSLTSYLKRESYGGRPFVYGPNFTTKIKSYTKASPVYAVIDDQYKITDYKTDYEYEDSDLTIFPRMYSRQPAHINTYRDWTDLKENEQPRYIDNLKFMFRYQFGHMYFRYLMFNFSGRASDVQHADWLGPFNWFEKLPESLSQNKARNNFLMLPFLLGVAGLFYHYKKDKVGFWSVMAFFLFLGLILVFYLNSPPNEPRERDYIYVGSYLAFSIWIGIGALGIYNFVHENFTKYPWVKYAGIITIFIPLMMLLIGFDDHNRNGRTLQVDHARNTLASCAPNAILFTGGDNDTFPLWYVQEVEGFRTDIRVIVLSYFNGDWYIDQMRRKVYDSEALPFSLTKENYRQGGLNDALPFVENSNIKGAINLHRYIQMVQDENKSLQVAVSGDTNYNSIPSRTFYMNINGDQVVNSKQIPQKYIDNIPGRLNISWHGNYMEKSAFMTLDLIAANQWERPIYFNTTSLNTIALNLKKHVLQEGLVFRLLPIQLDNPGSIDLEKMYDNMMGKWEFGDLQEDNIYYNHEDYQLRILQATKSSYNTLALELLNEGENKKAKKVVETLYSNFVKRNIDLDISLISTVELLLKLKDNEKAISLAEMFFLNADQQLSYFESKNDVSSRDRQIQLFILRQLGDLCSKHDLADLSKKYSDKFLEYYVPQ